MRYATALEPSSRDASDIAATLADSLAQKRGLDIRRGLTHSGPHRDDLTLTLDGRELRAFGSAGQQRTAAIALRLLEGETLRERLGAAPLLLLDDPFAELDVRRSARILELLAEQGMGQTLLTVPRETDIPPALTQLARWSIEQAQIVPEWTSLVGPQIAAVTTPQSIAADGTLFVAVTTNAWMMELSMMEPELLRAINAKEGRTPVRKIRWLLQRP
jgi:hypothetical protein